MAKYLRYMGEFLSRAGVTWRVEILQEADDPFANIGSLTFEADKALVIEWNHAEKEEVICGSIATLKIESPGDRTYEDLYTIEPGRIRMDVYRENLLYWSGALDPEFYEEPYEKAAHYTVSLTFSDFGVLDRLKYDLSDMRTLYEVVAYSIGRTSMNTVLDESLISTSLTPGGAAMTLADIKVRSDNFYDEDGEALTLKEVLEGVLQPLALRLVQRSGRVYIYDLNALYNAPAAVPVVWDGDSQTMGTDKVYNNVKITWSPYPQSSDLLSTECWTLDTDPNITALNMKAGLKVDNATIFSYHCATNANDWADRADSGFTLWTSEKGKNAEIVDDRAKFYKIVPQYDGQESEGIAIHWKGIVGHVGRDTPFVINQTVHGLVSEDLKGNTSNIGGIIFKCPPVWLPPVDNLHGLYLHVIMNLLFDHRFNPFENSVNWSSEYAHETWEALWNKRGNFIYVPVVIKFRPCNSENVYIWDNRDVVRRDVQATNGIFLDDTLGRWVMDSGTDESPSAWGYLSYYTTNDRAEKSGAIGWRANRPAINPFLGKLPSAFIHSDDGQYIPYPETGTGGGLLWVEVRKGSWIICDGGENLSDNKVIDRDKYEFWKGKYNWILCELPEIAILQRSSYDKKIKVEDVEYKAEINADAKEDIELDTICGSSAEGVPTARGAYFKSADGRQVTELSRAGRTSQVEDLLIGTLFSQFGQRRTTLSGEMQITDGPLTPYTEQNQEGKKFMLTEDIQDVIADVSDATITELRPDEYERRQD